ncbi:MAG: iron-containing alcohol dehydrogenase [Tateyamaria sp.]|uniref:iron-containing alcohol dehydrogenase n=1 Tax=Tateyamaria sp. TaxID=1929288 RepID=UPI0032DD3EAD
MQTFNMGQVPPVTFGAGRIRKLPDLVNDLGGGPVLVIADAVLADLGVTAQLTKQMSEKGIPVEIAAEVSGEPKEALVDALCERARLAGARVVVGLGGGAAMDAAKLVAAIAPCSQPAHTFALAAQPLPKNGLPAIAIPTTAGTGSEVTRTSVISKTDGSKIWFWGEELMFSQAILDPELTLSLPPHLTAWTGIDAVAHALEGCTARTTSPAGMMYGLEALRILTNALPGAVADGANINLRANVLWGSMVAGLTLHNCNTHMGHNISHALGSLTRVHHGLATGLALEVSLPWLVSKQEGHVHYARAAEALGGAAKAESLPDAFSDLMRRCNIAAELPAGCESVTAANLSAEMQNAANIRMARNAICDVTASDFLELASKMTALPVVTTAS